MTTSAFFLLLTPMAQAKFFDKLLDEWAADGQEFLHVKLPNLIAIALIALVLSRLIALATRRMVTVAEQKNAGAVRLSQVKTFSAILRTTLHAALWTLMTLQALSILGVNLGPLLASAGVAGIAVGLAAQTIVKDILNGTMILLEDQFNIGDTVRISGMNGVVEAMTLRRTEVRDGDGTLYVIPNSQITTVANLSREFSQATVNVSVDFSAPPDQILELLRTTAMSVRNDTRFAADFLADPQVLGVDAMHGSEVVYPVLFRTSAGKQSAPVREFRRQIRLALEERKMLPGDPYRTFHEYRGADENEVSRAAGHTPANAKRRVKASEAGTAKQVDITALPPQEHDLFGAE